MPRQTIICQPADILEAYKPAHWLDKGYYLLIDYKIKRKAAQILAEDHPNLISDTITWG